MKSRGALVLTGLAVIILSQGAAGAAVSAPSLASADHDVELVFTHPTVAAKYGDYWELELRTNGELDYIDGAGLGVFATVDGESGYHPSVYPLATGFYSPPETIAYISADPTQPPLAAGDYAISATAEGAGFGESNHGHTSSPAHLTVQPAPLGLELRAIADPNNPANAIVTAVFTGTFADNYGAPADVSAPKPPTGTLSITLTDSNGEVAVGHNVELKADAATLSTTFYWTDAVPGATYSVKSTFAPSGHTAQNFDIDNATPFDYTAPTEQRPVPTSTAAAAPPTEELPDPGFGLPLWLVVLASVVALGLAATTVVFIIKGARLGPVAKEATDAA